MKIRHYLCNAFIVEHGNKKIAIDPGFDTWIFKFRNYIPKFEWPSITHIIVTHGDIDHYWSPDQIAEISGASLICGKELVKRNGSSTYILDPRSREIKYSTKLENAYPLGVGDVLLFDDLVVEAFKAIHGSLKLNLFFGLINQTISPGPGERIGIGSTVYKININGKTIVNMGDTLLLKDHWKGLENLQPDVLMLPIGGDKMPNTITSKEALEVVAMIQPKIVIPCHYNLSFLWMKNVNPTDDKNFKWEVEKMGLQCTLMNYGDELIIE